MAKERKKLDDDSKAKEEEKYYNDLYDFALTISKANENSFEGVEPYRIANTLRNSLEVFFSLCMYDPELITIGKEKHFEKVKEEVKKELDVKPEQKLEKKCEGKFLKINAEGWGLCPECNTKVLKVTSITRLENFPVYCKKCKADHLVNWWNADKQRIIYKRYVSDSAIRNSAMKGTGLRAFMNSRTSATERVAIGK